MACCALFGTDIVIIVSQVQSDKETDIMNNSINYSDFVDLLLDTSDDFEPYGCGVSSNHAADAFGISDANLALHCDINFDEPWGE